MAVQKPIRLMDDTISSPQARAGRSPSYPVFGLETAVSKLKMFYKAQRTNAVSVGAALEALGYKGERSGTAGRTIAALIAFNLLSEEGAGLHRKVKINDLGRKIVLLEENDPERIIFLQEAAANPRIYREMLDTWSESLPTDTEMKKFLTINKGYNEETVRQLIRDFRATYEFAKLGNHGVMSDAEPDEIGKKNQRDESSVSDSIKGVVALTPPPAQPSQTRPMGPMGPTHTPPVDSLPHLVHLPGDRTVYFYVPRPFTEKDYTRLMGYLELFKDVIVSEDSEQAIQKAWTVSTVRTGPAMWKNRDVDQPINVIGAMGEREGRRYVKIEGSPTGVPLDEIEYEDETPGVR